MRESMGGAMIFWIVLFLFSIFIAFISFVIKYARLYKIKNAVINYISRQEGNINRENVDSLLRSMGYQRDGTYKICRYFPTNNGAFYYVELYSAAELPIAGTQFLGLKVTVKGETRTIERNEENNEFYSSVNTTGWFYGTNDQCYLCNIGQSCTTSNIE
jgi:hypothetical protein